LWGGGGGGEKVLDSKKLGGGEGKIFVRRTSGQAGKGDKQGREGIFGRVGGKSLEERKRRSF